jgi:stage II sporulation protein P
VPEDDIPEQPVVKPIAGEYLKTLNMNDSEEDLTSFTTHSGAIVEEYFGRCGGPGYIDLSEGGQVRNCTDLSAEELRYECTVPSGIVVERGSDEPQVLIMHTHTSESYEPYEKSWYDSAYISRSQAPENGVVAVGDAVAKELAEAGICVIHDCTVYDEPYNGAYTRSLYGTAEILERYPSVKIVLDIHRDAIEYPDGTRVSAVTEIDGKKAAQFMVICAADDGNYDVPDYIDNFHFACELQQEAEKLFPTLTRPILFQYCQYNQQLSKGALLIEVGSHGNSVDQAVYTGELIGKTLVSLLTGEAPVLTEALPTLSEVPFYFLGRVI